MNNPNFVQIKFKKLRDDAVLPYKGSYAAAAYDLTIPTKQGLMGIPIGATIKIPMGFATEIPPGWHVRIFPRSGLAIKRGLRLANSTAIIDEDYRGEYIVALYNDSDECQFLTGGERIAQMVIEPSYTIQFEVVEELSETERGEGGLGSTGMQEILVTKPPCEPQGLSDIWIKNFNEGE